MLVYVRCLCPNVFIESDRFSISSGRKIVVVYTFLFVVPKRISSLTYELTLLYVLHGAVTGVGFAIPLVIQKRNVTYEEQVTLNYT